MSELSDKLRSIDFNTVKKHTELDDIFAEEPVGLQTFIKDKKFLHQHSIDLSPVQFQIVQLIERVYMDGWTRSNEEGDWQYDKSADLYSKMKRGGFDPYWKTNVPMKNTILLQWG